MPHIKDKTKNLGITQGWSQEQAEYNCPNTHFVACHYNLKDTNYAVIDIDDKSYTLDQLFDDTDIDSCYLTGNTKGFHIWVEFENGKQGMFKNNIQDAGKPCLIDYLGEKVFERVGKEWVGDEPAYLQPSQFKNVLKKKCS